MYILILCFNFLLVVAKDLDDTNKYQDKRKVLVSVQTKKLVLQLCITSGIKKNSHFYCSNIAFTKLKLDVSRSSFIMNNKIPATSFLNAAARGFVV